MNGGERNHPSWMMRTPGPVAIIDTRAPSAGREDVDFS
ncbi:hypothetical protein Rhow_006210 [Rhodococcus wratislaviensis]|uniref:Uncharacterized protein n=1 Tax=Rhodococcus wratislaviensis TaxID=44752 RepID=A0A402CF64_RHOWR|nr:hypothetical protein Rhow_006210 [Rhodococcus wratislaviensis]